jgi:alkylation response protein AidB-like acyl-CoA dehydrogenase
VSLYYAGLNNAIVLITLYGNGEQLAQASHDALSFRPSFRSLEIRSRPAGVHVVGRGLRRSKIFCWAAGHASRAIIKARDDNGRSRLLLLALQQGEYIESMPFRTQGIRAATTKKIVFDGVCISAEALIEKPDDYTREPAFVWRLARLCS